MTKFVLNSGGLRNQPELKRQFHREVVTGLGQRPNILICVFAQAREYWEDKYAGYSGSIMEDVPEGVTPVFKLAMPSEFTEQCAWADAIWFSGGDDHLLEYWVRQFDYDRLFKDKVIATGSASSNLMTTAYWTCDWRACATGLGILPIKFISHYGSGYGNDDPRGRIDWSRAYEELKEYGDMSLEIVALHEGEYIIREV